MPENKTDVPYGTLDLLILKTLDTMGPMHGYRIARRIEQVAENLLRLNQGSIYPALIRLEEQGWINRPLVQSQKVLCRSEEHTSELQSHVNLVCRLLLEKKKT